MFVLSRNLHTVVCCLDMDQPKMQLLANRIKMKTSQIINFAIALGMAVSVTGCMTSKVICTGLTPTLYPQAGRGLEQGVFALMSMRPLTNTAINAASS